MMLKIQVKGVIIKKITVADISAVKELETQCGLSIWSFEDYLKELKREDSISIAAVTEKEIRGFMVARLIMTSNEAEIYNIGVKVEYRKKKIGYLLLNHFLRLCADCNINNVWLEVRQSNLGALNFYRRCGFQITSERKNFYKNPTDSAYVMKLSLV